MLNTHHHGDHTGSNAKFPPTAEIIAHINARNNMVDGKRRASARHIYSGNSDISGRQRSPHAVVRPRAYQWRRDDLFSSFEDAPHGRSDGAERGPLIDYSGGGSLQEWTATLDEALKLDFDTVIPGHGAVCKRQYLSDYRDVATKLPATVISMMREGKSKDDIAKVFMANGGLWVNPNVVNKLDQIMAELKN